VGLSGAGVAEGSENFEKVAAAVVSMQQRSIAASELISNGSGGASDGNILRAAGRDAGQEL
jgi:hypothetical protein